MFLEAFSHFKLCETAFFEPVDLKRGYTHLLKALKEEKLTQNLKMGVEVKVYGSSTNWVKTA